MKSTSSFEYRWREAANTPADLGAPAPDYQRTIEGGMIVERNVQIPVSAGYVLYADVFRPETEEPVPPIIAWTPYGKHTTGMEIYGENAGVTPDMISRWVTFEGPDPAYWVSKGYAVLNVDRTGSWYSQGDSTFLSPMEAADFYDAIEWAAVQSWSNGKVGLSGVSYLSQTQWRVAALKPPHLAAMNIWEGWTDTYREVARHGGIPDTCFWIERLANSWGTSTGRIEDLVRETHEHPLWDAFWESKAAAFGNIDVPAYIVACWADQGLHLRGTLEGYKGISSEHKWLEVHGRKKWAYYYTPHAVERLREFFDHFLLGADSPLFERSRVRLEAREAYFVGDFRHEDEWPVARTEYTRLYLYAANAKLSPEPAAAAVTASYSSLGSGPGAHRVQFDHIFDTPTDLIGHAKLHVYMSTDAGDDMDVFVGLYKIDADGNQVPFAYYAFFDDGPIALGWLRVSHCELDPDRTTEYQPWLKHTTEAKIQPGQILPLDIEIWPSGTHFEAGSRLRLILQGSDLQKYNRELYPIYTRHEETVNTGIHTVHAGGEYGSYLLVPVVPARK